MVAKLWLLDFNYCQSNRAQWKNLRAFLWLLDTITRYLLFLILLLLLLSLYYYYYYIIIIIIIVYLSIFIANKFLLTTVNKNFSKFKSFKILLTCRSIPSGDVSVHGRDFNKVAKRLCCDRASVLVFPVGLLHVWGHLPWRTPLEDCF